MTERPDDTSRKHQELMLRIARRPGFCCCCICIPREDRRRARRIFRLTRRVVRAWEKESKIEAERLTQDRP
jgi:hypothetical protein